MSWPLVLSAKLENGVLQLNRDRLRNELKGRQDCAVTITIERKHATRSLSQNALYWAVYVETISEHTGYTPDEIHELLKAKFLPKKVAIADGNGELIDDIMIGGTTTRLNKIQFGEYLQSIHEWASNKLGLWIPEPTDGTADEREEVTA